MKVFEKRGKKIIELGWEHGVFLDAWSIIHALTGSILALVFLTLDVSLLPGLIIALISMVLYEGLEMVADIIEDFENVVMDVLVGLVMFFLTYKFFVGHNSFLYINMIFVLSIVNTGLIYIGYKKYLKNRL